jgi:hypothetical protein
MKREVVALGILTITVAGVFAVQCPVVVPRLEPDAATSDSAPSVTSSSPPLAHPLGESDLRRVDAEPQNSEPAEEGGVSAAQDADVTQTDVGTKGDWEIEYANSPLSTLIADEVRLRGEYKQEMETEVERRFEQGRYTLYRHEEWPPKNELHTVVAGRGDEAGVKAVFLDPWTDPEVFRKEQKANWLLEQIATRKRP